MNYTFRYDVIWRNLDHLFFGLWIDVYMAVIAIALGTLIGLVVAFSYFSKNRVIRGLASWYVTIIRNIPLMIVVLFIYFGLPDAGIAFPEIPSFIFALTLYAGAYVAEVFRGGLQTMHKGMDEAGMALGMSYLQIVAFIKIPILFRTVMPALSNNYISLFKDGSIATVIAVPELTFQTRRINLESFRTLEAWTFTAAVYIVVVFILAALLRQVERKVRIPK